MTHVLPPAFRRQKCSMSRIVWFAALAWPLTGWVSGKGGELLGAAPIEPGAAPFVLREMFGVSHPDQIVTFDLSQSVDPQRTVLVDRKSVV